MNDAGPSWWAVPPACDRDEARTRHQENRAAWDEAAERYREEIDETVRFLREGGSSFHPIERAMLGELRPWCRRAIHLQCASGRDTLSLLTEGVEEVAGLDISDKMIENARRTSEALGLRARWFRCDVLDAPHELDGGFDLVYTGRGAICWIHDLEGWAAVVARLLRPGGVVSLFDDHPLTCLFDNESEALVPSGIDYFHHAECSRGWTPSYLGDLGIPVERQAVKHERLWPIASIVTALLGAGLTLERLGEHAERYYDNFEHLAPEVRLRLPLTFSLLARKLAPSG